MRPKSSQKKTQKTTTSTKSAQTAMPQTLLSKAKTAKPTESQIAHEAASVSSNELTYFRRCHHCGHINSSDNGGLKFCNECHKHLCSFYFCNEADDIMWSDDKRSSEEHTIFHFVDIINQLNTGPQRDERVKVSSLQDKYFPPIVGISFFWR